VNTNAITATYQQGVLTLQLPYKAPKPTGPRRVLVEGPSSPPRRLTARHTSLSPPTSPAAAAAAAVAAGKAAPAPATSPAQPRATHPETQQEEWVDVQKNHNEEQAKEEQVKEPALPAKERVNGELPAFEPVLQFVGEPAEKKDTNDNNTAPMSSEEKAAAWVADLEEEDDADAEDGSIEDCKV
jgi:hypothetical protein